MALRILSRSRYVLVDDVLLVDILQQVGSYDRMEISFHEVEYQIEVLIVFGSDNGEKGDNIGMACEFLQEHNLNQPADTSRKVRCASVAL